MNILIIGATGMVGQSALRECLLANDVERVWTLGRTPVPQQHAKLQQCIAADLMHAEAVLDGLHNVDACFFCVGFASGGMHEADYRRLTYDLTLKTAQDLLPNNPGMTFIYISGAGADSSEQGSTMWARVRGATENALQRLPFKAVYCFRPSLIQPLHGVRSKTTLYRWFYYLTAPFLPLLRKFSRTIVTSEELGKALLNAVRFGLPTAIVEAAEIRTLAQKNTAQKTKTP